MRQALIGFDNSLSGSTLVVVVFESDLFFSSKIENALKKFGLECKILSVRDDLVHALHEDLQGVIVNIDALGQECRMLQNFSNRRCFLLGYYSHVNVKAAEVARAAGVESFPRSMIISKLEGVLGRASY
ncbi:MAG TPA: hypothetical protein VEH56_00605 [Candidatus Saccharimonadales bacterium]|nr:hypothetical protein [Candidatus Saccharimonadales bacterium]